MAAMWVYIIGPTDVNLAAVGIDIHTIYMRWAMHSELIEFSKIRGFGIQHMRKCEHPKSNVLEQ